MKSELLKFMRWLKTRPINVLNNEVEVVDSYILYNENSDIKDRKHLLVNTSLQYMKDNRINNMNCSSEFGVLEIRIDTSKTTVNFKNER